jgi:hypothetical protein
MKGAIAVLAMCALAVLATLALYHMVRWAAAARSGGGMAPRQDPELTRLQDEKRRLLNHLREVRFDWETGKLDDADYRALRNRYEREAAHVLGELERHVERPA